MFTIICAKIASVRGLLNIGAAKIISVIVLKMEQFEFYSAFYSAVILPKLALEWQTVYTLIRLLRGIVLSGFALIVPIIRIFASY